MGKENWETDAKVIVKAGTTIGVGFGVMGFVLYILVTALGLNTAGGNFVNVIINAFLYGITNILPGVIDIAFVGLLYVIVKKVGLL